MNRRISGFVFLDACLLLTRRGGCKFSALHARREQLVCLFDIALVLARAHASYSLIELQPRLNPEGVVALYNLQFAAQTAKVGARCLL
jgi:hypothetical protein